MMFAFLPTAIMYILNIALMLLSFYISFTAESMKDIGISLCLFLISFISMIAVVVFSLRLYLTLLPECGTDFEKWYAKQKRISKRAVGGNKTAVLLNMAYGCIANERTEEAAECLTRVKKRVERSGKPIYTFIYLSNLLHYKEIQHDLSNSATLLAHMQEQLQRMKFRSDRVRVSYINRFEYICLSVELYKRTPEMLSGAERELTQRYNIAANTNLQNIAGAEKSFGYSELSLCYGIALSNIILGSESQAQPYLEAIAGSGLKYPLVQRVERYLSKKDISILMETMP